MEVREKGEKMSLIIKFLLKAGLGMMIGFRVPWTDIRDRPTLLDYCIAHSAIAERPQHGDGHGRGTIV